MFTPPCMTIPRRSHDSFRLYQAPRGIGAEGKRHKQARARYLVGSYTVSNFSATSDGRGGTDPPVTSGGSVATNTEISSGGGSAPRAFLLTVLRLRQMGAFTGRILKDRQGARLCLHHQ
jgi:hypothetical protein